MAWEDAWPELIDSWDPGTHMLIFGRTGTGKSHFALHVLDGRAADIADGGREASVAIAETKARDAVMRASGWPIIDSWPPTVEQRQQRRIIVWPHYNRASEQAERVRPVFLNMLDEIMLEGGWTIYLDETNYFVENLNMRATLDEFWQGGRSSEITVVAGSQRPVWVNRGMVSQAQWAVIFFTQDQRDRQTIGEILGSAKRFPPVIASLRKSRHECLVLRTDTGRGIITSVPAEQPRLELNRPEERWAKIRGLLRRQ